MRKQLWVLDVCTFTRECRALVKLVRGGGRGGKMHAKLMVKTISRTVYIRHTKVIL